MILSLSCVINYTGNVSHITQKFLITPEQCAFDDTNSQIILPNNQFNLTNFVAIFEVIIAVNGLFFSYKLNLLFNNIVILAGS